MGIAHSIDSKKFVGRFKDLTADLPFVRNNGLEKALVHAQFYNGNEIYDNNSRKILFELVK
jgi:hypothetical protein